jgi:hypothetical protein
LNRELREHSLDALYGNLTKNDSTNSIPKPKANTHEPVTKRPFRLAAKKPRIALEYMKFCKPE